MLIDLIAGARPNFVKLAGLIHEGRNFEKIKFRIIHTGQHYDSIMSDIFFEELKIPKPHINLNSGNSSGVKQISDIMVKYDDFLNKEGLPDLVIVFGDVNSTLACSITAKKNQILLGHIEAGIRSGDLSMPEESNRIMTDSISNLFFTTTQMASQRLVEEGKKSEDIFFVGNIMIDTLIRNIEDFKKPQCFTEFKLKSKKYSVITIHRPSNVNDTDFWKDLILTIEKKNNEIFVFPCHPRTQSILKNRILPKNLKLINPLGYLEFNYLVKNSGLVITDSGGITEETTVLGIPCITLRHNTERPETIEVGTNELIGNDFKMLDTLIDKAFSNNWKDYNIPDLWDGNTSTRILKIISNLNI